MKNKILLKNSIALLLPLAMATGALLGARNTKVQEVSAYTSESSLPTTIDLNDTSASNIRSYYSSLNSLSTSERQGTNLLKNLKTILKNGQKYYSYDSGNFVWQIYEIADRDWSKSPASSTTYGTYNSSTNKITNYVYGTSASSSKNNPYVHSLYTNRNVSNEAKAWGDHTQTNWGINREHVWPKAEGFETSGDGGARGDPMHLMAGNGYANNIHSNYYYGYVDTSKSYTNCGDKYSYTAGNLLGTSKTVGGTTNVFEPQDSDKGDIARAIFYMVARYNYLSGSDSDGINSNNPNLSLTQSLSDWSKTSFASTTSTKGYMGIMTDLLAWHHADPVDEYEIHRNNLLYTNYTNNRNPFIDFPQWVDYIWGTATYSGTNYQSYSSTPTGYATPSSDTINGYNSSGTVSVTGVSLNKNSTSLVVGDTETLTATISPSNASNQSVTWTSSKTSVATVSNGVVTAKAAGTATITVKTSDGNKTATCSVTVSNPAKTLSSIAISGEKTSYTMGDSFVKPTITATFSDSTTSNVTSSASFNGFDTNLVGQQTITVSYTYGGITKTASYTITVTPLTTTETSGGSATASNGAISGWTIDGAGSAYQDGSVKLDSSGDSIYKLDLFTGNVSLRMVNLKVTINAKANTSGGATPSENNSYLVEAISESNQNIIVKGSEQKTGSDVFTATEYNDVVFEITSGLFETTGIRITYAIKGSGNFAVMSITWVATYSTVDIAATSISANVLRSFFVGETIQKTDVLVQDNLGRTITDFTYTNYLLSYSDAPGGGDNVFEKDFDLTYDGMETTFTVNFERKPFVASSINLVASDVFSSLGGSNAYLLSGSIRYESIKYIYQSAYYYSGGSSLSFGNSSSQNGFLKNETPFDSGISNVEVESSGRDVNIRYSVDGTSWVLKNAANVSSNTYKYFQVDCIGTSGSSYGNISSISIALKNSAENLANLIMYEDTENQCTSKFTTAKDYFEGLTKAQRSSFMTSGDYIIENARLRFEAWATHLGKQIAYSNNDYVISDAQNYLLFDTISSIKEKNALFFVVIGLLTGVTLVGAFILIKRRKQESK